MKKFIYLLALVIVTGAMFISCDNDDSDYYWAKTFTLENDLVHSGFYGLAVDSSGGAVLAGHSNNRACIARLDDKSEIIWQRTFDKNAMVSFPDIISTSDGGYLYSTASNREGTNPFGAWLLKLDKNGTSQWQREYYREKNVFSAEATEAHGGGYIIAGYAYKDGNKGFVMRTDNDGYILWQKYYPVFERITALKKMNGSGYAVGGYTTEGIGYRKGIIMTIDNDGEVTEARSFGREEMFTEITSLDINDDNEIITAGMYRPGIEEDYSWSFVKKFSSSLLPVWEKIYDFGPSDDNELWNIKATRDGGCIVIGLGWKGVVVLTNMDLLAFKLDSTGTVKWQKFYDIADRGYEYIHDVDISPYGYLIAGKHSTSGLLMSISSEGDVSGGGIRDYTATVSELDEDFFPEDIFIVTEEADLETASTSVSSTDAGLNVKNL